MSFEAAVAGKWRCCNLEVSASIMASKGDIFEFAKMLRYANIDYLHLDIFQNGSGFKFQDLNIFDNTYLPLDIHLIFETIGVKEIEIINRARPKFVNIQYETLRDKNDIIKILNICDAYLGIAITSATPLNIIDFYADKVSQILVMCSEPGVSGAKFDESNYERIEVLRSKYPSLRLFVDGGIDEKKAEIMRKLGVSVVVSGSYLEKMSLV